MGSVRVTYKIVVDPTSFEYAVIEIKIIPQRLGNDIEKRRVENDELATWTKDEFMERMSEYGYGTAAKSYLERNAITFSCGQQP